MLAGGIKEGEKWVFPLHKMCFCHGPKDFSAFLYTLGAWHFYGLKGVQSFSWEFGNARTK